jgi:hypothetical protein
MKSAERLEFEQATPGGFDCLGLSCLPLRIVASVM